MIALLQSDTPDEASTQSFAPPSECFVAFCILLIARSISTNRLSLADRTTVLSSSSESSSEDAAPLKN